MDVITGIVVTPAYGKDYKSKIAVLKDWNDGKDFLAHTPHRTAYISKNDCPKEIETIEFRYGKLRKAFILKR